MAENIVNVGGLAIQIPLTKIEADHDLRSEADSDLDHQLESSIRSVGLLQPLVVCEHPDGRRKGAFRLLAGYRRYRALCNIHAGSPDTLVPAMIPHAEPDKATVLEVGIAENVVRSSMHEAELALAMQALIAAGQSATVLAERFGVPRIDIRRAAALADLDPRILKDCRQGLCSLDLARTLTQARSPEHGWEMYEALEEHERVHDVPWTVTAALRSDVVSGNQGLAKLVGIDAYREAGGDVIENLFSGDAEEEILLADPDLLTTLASAVLDERVQNAGPILKGAEAIIEPEGYTHTVFPFTDWEEGAWPEDDAPDDSLKGASVLVSVHSNTGEVNFSLPHWPIGAEDEVEDEAESEDAEEPVAEPEPTFRYTSAMTNDLAQVWAGSVQRHVATNWKKTWDLALFLICKMQFRDGVDPVNMTIEGQWLTEAPSNSPELAGGVVDEDLTAEFEEFQAMPLADKKRLAAHAAARLLTPCMPGESGLVDHLAKGLDMTKYWVPDARSFWSRLSKSMALEVLLESGVSEEDLPDIRLPKDELVQACADLARKIKLVLPEHRMADKEAAETS